MSDLPDIPEGADPDEILAAELALRLLEGEEAEAAQRRVLTDRAFADRVAAWNVQFSDLAGEVEDVSPSIAARRDLMDRLFADPRRAVPVPTLWQRLSGVVGVAGLAAAVLMGVLFYSMPAPGPVYVSEVVSPDGGFRYLAFIDTEARTMRLVRTDGAPPETGALELWGHAPDDPAISLGVISVDARIAVPIPDILQSTPDGLIIGISNEPEGGSPTGQPTNVLAIGQATEL